mmetsp:Transcript_40584/g.95302  ORF Transcript_40584/g.95302 Transcript_40584/m.95302 type:complete len:80 (+) Transcript_40584:976-1215(+)
MNDKMLVSIPLSSTTTMHLRPPFDQARSESACEAVKIPTRQTLVNMAVSRSARPYLTSHLWRVAKLGGRCALVFGCSPP